MKKFRFKLDSVLTVRRFRKNQAAFALAEAQNKRIELATQCSEAQQFMARMEDELLACFRTSTRTSEIVRHQNSLTYQRLQIAEIERNMREALEKEDRCREIVLVARQSEETILRLREKEKERYLREQEKEDELAIIDFVNSRHHLINAL